MRRYTVALFLAFLLAACHEGANTDLGSAGAAGDQTLQVGLATGTVVLTVPAGSVAAGTEVAIDAATGPVPEGLGVVGGVIRLSPADQTVDPPATLTVAGFNGALPAGTDAATLTLAYVEQGGALVAIPTSPFLGSLIGSLDHLGDVVLVAREPRTVRVATTRDPLLGRGRYGLTITVGSQVAGADYPLAEQVALATDAGLLSTDTVETGASPAFATLTAAADATATVSATADGLAIANQVEVELRLPVVRVETTLGGFDLRLFPADAPGHVANFLAYVGDGFYVDTLVHRVIDGFVIQGGGFTAGPTRKTATRPAISTEADNGLSNVRGTLSLALSGNNANSGTSEWFINLGDNSFLDAPAVPGFTVFGEVSRGMAVVDAIGAVATDASDFPVDDVVVTRATVAP